MLIRIGGNNVNPAHVVRVRTVSDEDGHPHTIVHLSDGDRVMTDDYEENVVALINANL